MFGGRWDDSLPKAKDGSFFIDRKPELFLPLLDFLRDLAAMVPSDVAGSHPTPPMTPSFSNQNDEIAFRRMVDSYDLTNVLYSYEIYQHPSDTRTDSGAAPDVAVSLDELAQQEESRGAVLADSSMTTARGKSGNDNDEEEDDEEE